MANEEKKNEGQEKHKESIFEDRKYLDLIYSENRKPQTDYPAKLAAHLRDEWYGGKGTLLDIGCGRGDMLKALAETGFTVAGVDLSPISTQICKPHPVKIVDLEKDELPYDTGSFQYVFSKSVVEHLRNTTAFLREAYRVIEPGGTAVIMTPSWIHNNWGPFYLDFTHVTPFTAPSLRDAMTMAGFDQVRVIHFYQLPFLWRRPWLTPFVRILAALPLRYSPMYDIDLPQSLNTLFRFSNEVMLLAIGRKLK